MSKMFEEASSVAKSLETFIAHEKKVICKINAEGYRTEINKINKEKDSLRKEIVFYKNKIKTTALKIKDVDDEDEALLQVMREELMPKVAK